MCMPWHNYYGAFNFQTPCWRWCLVGYQLSRSFKNGSSHLLPFHFLLQCYYSSARREMLWNFRRSASYIDSNSCSLRRHIITQSIPRKILSGHLNWYLLWFFFSESRIMFIHGNTIYTFLWWFTSAHKETVSLCLVFLPGKLWSLLTLLNFVCDVRN